VRFSVNCRDRVRSIGTIEVIGIGRDPGTRAMLPMSPMPYGTPSPGHPSDFSRVVLVDIDATSEKRLAGPSSTTNISLAELQGSRPTGSSSEACWLQIPSGAWRCRSTICSKSLTSEERRARATHLVTRITKSARLVYMVSCL
jgi:hypothetical protein